MVEIRIFIEGGIVPHENDSVNTINNSEKLREGFHKLLSKIVLHENFSLIIEMKGGVEYASKSFIEYALSNESIALMIDLDDNKSTKKNRLLNLKLEDFSTKVFFMVQEMEAWILSQPEAIEKVFNEIYIKKRPNEKISEVEKIFSNIDPENISKPSTILKVVIARHYSETKGNKTKDKKYAKLKDSPSLLENLDPKKLVTMFEDVKNFSDYINKQP